MKILHVTIANPMLNQGGLNRYCKELMECEESLGHSVFAIYPGLINKKKIEIKKVNSKYYTINGALPVALTYGIDDPKRYMRTADTVIYEKWLKFYKYDIIHVHSIQGIHKEFFDAAKLLGIPMVFTTHDYYPICMKCNLVDDKNKICNECSPYKCHGCNAFGGLSIRTQIIRQSRLYSYIKNKKFFVELLKHVPNNKNNSVESEKEIITSKQSIEDYSRYIEYRKEIFENFNLIHCNSYISRDIYKKYFPDKRYEVLPITHSRLKRTEKSKVKKNTYNIGYMGGMSKHKGYDTLESALAHLENKGIVNWNAWFYGGSFTNCQDSERRHYCSYFTPKEEENIWEKLDILVVPSQWYETFGFVVLEALCHGIPVVCSDLVGSKYLVEKVDNHLVFQYDNINSLSDAIEYLLEDRDNYYNICMKINMLDLHYDMKNHTQKILNMYLVLV